MPGERDEEEEAETCQTTASAVAVARLRKRKGKGENTLLSLHIPVLPFLSTGVRTNKIGKRRKGRSRTHPPIVPKAMMQGS